MPLPDPIIEVLTVFRPLFTAPTWRKLMTLLSGTRLSQGRRPVAAALRASGNEQATTWSCFHQVLNRARWSPLGSESPAPSAHCRDLCASRSVRGSDPLPLLWSLRTEGRVHRVVPDGKDDVPTAQTGVYDFPTS